MKFAALKQQATKPQQLNTNGMLAVVVL